MKSLFQKQSIKQKINFIVIFSCGVILFIASAAFIGIDYYEEQQCLVNRLTTISHCVGIYCVPALNTSNKEIAKEKFSIFNRYPNVIAAYLYDKNGVVFTKYVKKDIKTYFDFIDMQNPNLQNKGYLFQNNYLYFFSKIINEGQEFGAIAIKYDLADPLLYLKKYRYTMGSILVISIIIGILLSNALQKIVSEPILYLSRITKKVLNEKNYSIRTETMKSSEEINVLFEGFNEMLDQLEKHKDDLNNEKARLDSQVKERTAILEQRTLEIETQNQLKTGQEELNVVMRGEQNIPTLGKNIIRSVSKFLGANVGAIYVFNSEEDILKLIGSYAYYRRKDLSNDFKEGEGIVGQVILEKQYIIITNCSNEELQIRSGIFEALPDSILAYPLILDDSVIGVIELGSLNKFTDFHLNFMKQIEESIAIALNSAISRETMSQLLEQTQKQTEELQVREEELRIINEELEKQTFAMIESEQRLKRQQAELQKANEELERQKKDTETKNKELEVAQTLIEEKANDLELSNKYKSEFLANMSHELRTPLNSILLLSRHLSDNRDGSFPRDCVESAQTIYSSGSDLLKLINDILDLSKIESGKMDINKEDVKIKELIKSLNSIFEPVAHEKNLSLNFLITDSAPEYIQTDRQRVEQILNNFLSNAFKFTSNGGVEVRISKIDSLPDNITVSETNIHDLKNLISFVVSDSGPGIPKEKQKLVFEAFQQIDGSISRRFGGTGLGLSIAKEFAKLLNGFIGIKSLLIQPLLLIPKI